MHRLRALVFLGILLLSSQGALAASGSSADWPSLGGDAADNGYNAAEHTLTAANVLKMRVKWTASISAESYPIVANRRVYVPFDSGTQVHIRALDITTGKVLTTYFKNALGGILYSRGNLVVAGSSLQELSPTSTALVDHFKATPAVKGGTFLDPVSDGKVIVAGYTSTKVRTTNSLYGLDGTSMTQLWKLPSASATGTIGTGHILTETSGGGGFYDEASGKEVASQPLVFSGWFAGTRLAYTVASVGHKDAALYAYAPDGTLIWHRTVGPAITSLEWPHAVGPDGLYVRTLKPYEGVEALDPNTGDVLWTRKLPDIGRIVLANGMVFVLTYNLAKPVRLVVLRADTGKPLGALVLSSDYYAFNEPNGLMVADGMAFIRAVGPTGQQLVALGL